MQWDCTQMDLECITLSEISQKEKDKYCMISLICRIEKVKQDIEYNNNNNKAESQIQGTNQWLPVEVEGVMEERRIMVVGEWEVQTIGSKKGSGMRHTTQLGLYPLFCNNCKHKLTFKNCIKMNFKMLKKHMIE